MARPFGLLSSLSGVELNTKTRGRGTYERHEYVIAVT